MGQAKRQLERYDSQRRHAREILIAAENVKRCWAHDDILIAVDPDLTPAYKLANYRLSRDVDLQDCFTTSRELTDMIKAVFSDGDDVYDKCPLGDVEH